MNETFAIARSDDDVIPEGDEFVFETEARNDLAQMRDLSGLASSIDS
jgi:hypothetical protein